MKKSVGRRIDISDYRRCTTSDVRMERKNRNVDPIEIR